MKHYLVLFSIIGFSAFVLAAGSGDALTQQDVARLLELKIPEQTIVEKVKASGTAFVLGADDIARLKQAGATEALIAAMQGTSAASGAAADTAEISDLVLIVDYSGSMNAKMKDGATKVASAKKCVADLIEKLPNDLNVSLVIYGTSKARGCDDIDIVQPLGPIDKAALKSKIAGFNATGMTPIAASLTKAGEELKKAKGGSAIVLVTDGAESCHGDPAGVAAKLAAEFGVKFGINVIGFGIEPKEKAELASIADKGHGKLLTVENANELSGALQKVVAERVAPAPKQRETKEYEAGGTALKPGSFFGDAAVAAPGDYKGELAMKEAKYYQLNLRKGQELRAIGLIQKATYQADNHEENETFVVSIYDRDLAQVAREKSEVEGNPTDPVTLRATWTADADGPVYVAIAASDNHAKDGKPVPPQKDPKPSPFTLKLKVEGENTATPAVAPSIARSEVAGGSGFNGATDLNPPILVTNDLKLGEAAFYKFAVKKGDPVTVSAGVQKPWYEANNTAIEAEYAVTLYDDDQVQAAQKKTIVKMNPPDAQTFSLTWTATVSGSAYLTISAKHTGEEIIPKGFQPAPGRMSLQVSTNGGAAAGSPPDKKADDAFDGAESTPSP